MTSNSQFNVTFVSKDGSAMMSSHIKAFCNNRSIWFAVRQYDAKTYEEDCEYITSLPAIHLYRDSHHIGTYYLTEDPLKSIQTEINNYKIKQQTKVSLWRKFMNLFKTEFNN